MDRPRARMLAAASGPAFVVMVLAGNSLTESAVAQVDGGPGAEALAAFAAYGATPAAQAGLVVELLAFTSLLVFAGWLGDLFRRRGGTGVSGVLAVLALLMMLGVKLGSGAALLAGIAYADQLSPEAALALSATNEVAFVLAWLPFAVFVLAGALALGRAAALGRVGVAAGTVIGGLGIAAALAGALNPTTANPVPFLLGLLWTLVVGIRLVLAELPGRSLAAADLVTA